MVRDCLTMCFDICTINIRVGIRVRGLHLVNEPSISMGHLYHGYVSHNQRVSYPSPQKKHVVCRVVILRRW